MPCPRRHCDAVAPGRRVAVPGRADPVVTVRYGMSIARVAEPSGSLQEAKEWGLDREDLLGIYRNMLADARTRGARPHPLPAGQDPGLVLHGPRQRGLGGRDRDRDGARRRRHAAPPRHGRPRHARRRAVAHLRQLHGPRRRPGQGQGRQRAPGRHPPRSRRDGLAPAGDAPGRGRLRARLPDQGGEAGRGRLVRRGLVRPRRRARGDELRRASATCRSSSSATTTAGPTRRRRTSSTRSSTSPTAPRPTASRASSSTAPTHSPCTARRSARSRRRARAAARP